MKLGFIMSIILKPHFKKGINIIKHTYNYDISGSIDLITILNMS